MKFLIGAFIAIWGITMISGAISHRDHKAIDKEAQIVGQHESILSELGQISDASVLEFVNDWRLYYANKPQTEKTLAELKVIRSKIQEDTHSAKSFTMEANRKKADSFNRVITSFAGPIKPKPGL